MQKQERVAIAECASLRTEDLRMALMCELMDIRRSPLRHAMRCDLDQWEIRELARRNERIISENSKRKACGYIDPKTGKATPPLPLATTLGGNAYEAVRLMAYVQAHQR